MSKPAPAPEAPNALLEQMTVHRNRARKLVEQLDVEAITARGMQLRAAGTDAEAVARYADAYRDGEALPPIVVYRDADDVLWLADGHHRLAAAKRAQLAEIDAIVRPGDRRDATLYAAGANGQHGLPLTNADKRQIVSTLLADATWSAWSNREIARVTRTSEGFVRLVRKDTGTPQQEIKRKDGTTQRPRNAKAKQPRQTSLLDACADERATVDATWQRMRELPGSSHMHETKCRILSAMYHYVQGAEPGMDPAKCYQPRRVIEMHIGCPVDVHAGQLCAAGTIDRGEKDTFEITDATYLAIDRLLRPPKPVDVASPPAIADEPIDAIAQRGADYIERELAKGEPEDITAPADPTPSPELPRTDAGNNPPLRPIGLRRLDKQRELVALRLIAGNLVWSGSDDDLFLLARIAGVPSAPTAWLDATRATARVDFISALARECAERVRSGEAMNARKWPQIPELCRLWGIDHQAIEIQSEHAVPE